MSDLLSSVIFFGTMIFIALVMFISGKKTQEIHEILAGCLLVIVAVLFRLFVWDGELSSINHLPLASSFIILLFAGVMQFWIGLD